MQGMGRTLFFCSGAACAFSSCFPVFFCVFYSLCLLVFSCLYVFVCDPQRQQQREQEQRVKWEQAQVQKLARELALKEEQVEHVRLGAKQWEGDGAGGGGGEGEWMDGPPLLEVWWIGYCRWFCVTAVGAIVLLLLCSQQIVAVFYGMSVVIRRYCRLRLSGVNETNNMNLWV